MPIRMDNKPLYNLNVVVRETGINPATLRAWERRYGLPRPERTKGGHRLYSQYDIETIKWLLMRQKEEGMSISRAVKLWHGIAEKEQEPLDYTPFMAIDKQTTAAMVERGATLTAMRENWVRASANFDEAAAEQVLTQSFALYPIETVCVEILQKGLANIGERWYQGEFSVQQEHFATELAMRRLHTLLTAAPRPVLNSTLLVGCPPQENHAFSSLLITLFLRYRGWRVVYLGANVPKDQLHATIESTKPAMVVMTAMQLITAATLFETASFISDLDVPLAFGGRVFNAHPHLQKQIPGFFLGEELAEAVQTIESLLKAPLPYTEAETKPKDYSQTISLLLDSEHLLESSVLAALEGKLEWNAARDSILAATQRLSKDIVAALSLGSLDLLESSLEWIKGYLNNRQFRGDLITEYLSTYVRALEANLDRRGKPIADWLAAHI